jgi:predicted TIM-barrel fold metal-dependent hydrolase
MASATQHSSSETLSGQRLLIVSADSHAQALPEDYRPFVESRYREAFDEWAAGALSFAETLRARKVLGGTFTEEFIEAFEALEEVQAGGESGYWDFARRAREMDRDGIAAEVIFPQREIPFWTSADPSASPLTQDPELLRAGARIFHRWLGARCESNPGRHAGICLLTSMDDPAQAARDLAEAHEAGARGGVLLPPTPLTRWPLYNDARYEPIWEVCEALGIPAHTHGGGFAGWVPPIGGAGAARLMAFELGWKVRRVFWVLYYGEVFERHPHLKFVMTEQGVEWIPEMLAQVDGRMTGHGRYLQHLMWSDAHRNRLVAGLSTAPAEVWKRQCFAGASFMHRFEAELRHDVGIDQIMWGADYPHLEGTWPKTAQWLRDTFHDVPVAEVAQMLGGNALRCYASALDAAQLRGIADRIGPAPSAVVGGAKGRVNAAAD